MKAFFVYYKEMIEKNCNLNSHQGVSRIGIIKKAIELLKWQRSLIWELRQCTATRFKDFHAPCPSQLSSTTARPSYKKKKKKDDDKKIQQGMCLHVNDECYINLEIYRLY